MNPALHQARIRIVVLALLCLAAAAALMHRFYVVQIVRHEELLGKARERVTTTEDRMKQRGRIFDAQGYLLVGNRPMVYVVCSPYSVVHEPFIHLEKSLKPGVRESIPGRRERRRRMVAQILAAHFGKSAEEYYDELNPFSPRRDPSGLVMTDEKGSILTRPNHFLQLAKAASPETVAAFKADMNKADLHLGGFVFKDIFVRHYPKGRLMSNILGYADIGKDHTAEHGGLEQTLRKNLRGKDSTVRIEQSAKGQALPYGEISVQQAGREGDDIYLTVREPIQSILEEELDAAAAEFPAESIYAVIVDPRTGNILALGQRPNFDPNDTSTFSPAALSNKLAVNAYEPGSVMKPFMIAKAIDFGVIAPDSIIDCGSAKSWSYCGSRLNDPRGYGKMTPGGILRKSSNIGTAKVALMMGEEKVHRTLTDFGFGSRTGLPFASESRGRVPRYPFPDKLTVTRAPIGYAVQVTALQLARGYCAIANGGWMPQLRLLDRRRDADSGQIVEYPREAPVQVFRDPGTAAAVTDMLISVTSTDPTDRGTGWRGAIPGYEVAGKTGTCQKLIYDPATKKNRYGNLYRATFCGFAPAHHPEVVMVITFDGVSGERHAGGNVAAPVFKRTVSRILQHMDIRPDFPEKMERAERRSALW